jgi:hypothetical protein
MIGWNGCQLHEAMRAGSGITNCRVFRKSEDSNDLLILFDVADLAKARAFGTSDELKAVMQKAGVVGAPEVPFIE